MIEGLKCLWCGEAERVGAVHPGEGKAQWDFTCVYKYLVKEFKENEPDPSNKKTRSNGHKLNRWNLIKHKKKTQICPLL